MYPATYSAKYSAKYSAVRVLMLVVLTISLSVLASCDRRISYQGMALDPPKDLPAFEFTRADGSAYSTAPEPGKPMVVFFGYTHCPDICPTTIADWKRIREKLGNKADRVRFVFATVDPERDTPSVVERYTNQYDKSFIGLSGNEATTAAIMKAFGVAAMREENPTGGEYLVGHSAQVFLVNDKGQLVALYSFGTSWESLASDLNQLL